MQSLPSQAWATGLCVTLVLGVAGTAIASDPEEAAGPSQPSDEEPSLPAGLENNDDEPSLPSGLDASGAVSDAGESLSAGALLEWGGFLDLRAGARLQEDPDQSSLSLGELRLQLRGKVGLEWVTARVVVDLIDDHEASVHAPDLERGEGAVDLRTFDILLSPLEFADLRIGRQVLTWGVGDLVFLNDMFPKDWNAFFLGRDLEYLKAPADVVLLSLYVFDLTLDVVYGPRFNPDRFPDRRRLSFYDPTVGAISGGDTRARVTRRDAWFEDFEVATRLAGTLGAWELAAYGYRGFWKTPVGFSPARGRPFFPRLVSAGASARGPVLRGMLSAETAAHMSLADRRGDKPLVPNSQTLFLLGYERELIAGLNLGMQYMGTVMLNHREYQRILPSGIPEMHEIDHLVTIRMGWQNRKQTLRLSVFGMWGITQEDAYVRPHASWAVTDSWRLEVGANVLKGARRTSRFGQFRRNTNVWGALRYGF